MRMNQTNICFKRKSNTYLKVRDIQGQQKRTENVLWLVPQLCIHFKAILLRIRWTNCSHCNNSSQKKPSKNWRCFLKMSTIIAMRIPIWNLHPQITKGGIWPGYTPANFFPLCSTPQSPPCADEVNKRYICEATTKDPHLWRENQPRPTAVKNFVKCYFCHGDLNGQGPIECTAVHR